MSLWLDTLVRGWPGWLAAYGSVEAGLVGRVRGQLTRERVLGGAVLGAPLMVGAAAVAGLAGAWLQGHGITLPGWIVGGSVLASGVASGWAGGSLLLPGRARSPASRYQRGALVVDAPRSRASGRGQGNELQLAGVSVPSSDETKHFKFIGTTGTGKSTAIAELLSQALARGDRAVIADPDGGYMRRFYRPERGDVVLNPFHPRSLRWDPMRELRAPYDAEQLARSLIAEDDGAERSWRGYARTFVTALLQRAQAAGVEDVGELYRLAVVADDAELRVLTAGTAAQPFLQEHNGRMFDSIRSVTSSALGALEHVAQQRASGFSVRDWVSGREGTGSGVLFLPYRAGEIAALRSMVSAWMRLALFETMHGEERDARLWFVVDELDALGAIDGLKDGLARVRKFGGRCVLGLQSIAQVASTYGAGDAHTIVENCGNTMILRCSASEGGGTARFASSLIGQREVVRTSRSRSRRPTEWLSTVSLSEHVGLEPAVLDAQIEQLPDLHGYLKLASGAQWRRVRIAREGVRSAAPHGAGRERALHTPPGLVEGLER